MGLRQLLDQAFGPDALAAFQERVRAQLNEPHESRIGELRRQLAVVERTYDRLVRLLRDVGEDSGTLEREVRTAHAERTATAAKLKDAQAQADSLDREALEAQLAVDPRALLGQLLSSAGEDVPAAQVALQQVLPQLRLIERPRRYHATFEVHLVPSAAVALATGTQASERIVEVWHIKVLGRARAPQNWTVEVVRQDA
jgi:chromosome segregation ATPase